MEKTIRLCFYAVASILFYEFLSGLYIYFGIEFTGSYQFNLLFHTLFGFFSFLPLIFYQYLHFKKAHPGWKGGFRLTGYISYLVVAVISLTGVYLAVVGFEKDAYFISDIHFYLGILGFLFIIFHIFMKALQANWSFLASFGLTPAKSLLILLIVSSSIFVVQYLFALSFTEAEYAEEIPSKYSLKLGDNPFYPSEATTESGKFINADLLGNSPGCAQAGCHSDIYDQWNSSAHRYSSTDVFYRKAEAYMVETEGKEATRYCGGCHDPVALLSGAINTGVGLDSKYSHEGSSCIVCHSVSSIRHLKGSGSYVVKAPRRYLFANSESEFSKFLNRLLIRIAPSLHKMEYTKDFYSDPEYCATCHKQYIKDPNDWGWVKLQDQYGEWLSSPFSGRNDKGFNKEEVKACRDCHMPLVASKDPSAGSDGMVRSHRFVAANTAIPWLDGDETQYNLTKDWLKGRKLLVSIFPPRDKEGTRNQTFVDNELFSLAEPSPYVTLGEDVELLVAVTNARVGHSFPNGPLDIYESWLEVKVVDGQNNVIFHGGDIDDEGNVLPENTRFFFTLGLNRKGALIDKHNLWHMVGNAYKKLIRSGETDISKHKFKVPYWTKGDITVMARVRYRRFNKWFTDWVFDGKDIRLPIVDMARSTISIPVRKQPEQEKKARR